MVLEEEKKKESLKMHIKNKKAGPHRSFFKPLQTTLNDSKKHISERFLV